MVQLVKQDLGAKVTDALVCKVIKESYANWVGASA